jgi:hypothetical protein
LSPHLSPESKNVIASIVACRAAEDRLFLWRSAQFVWRHCSCFHGLGAPLLATGHAQHFRIPFFRTQLFCRHTSLPRTTFSRTLDRHTYISFTHTHTHISSWWLHIFHTPLFHRLLLKRKTFSFITRIPFTCSTFSHDFLTRTFVNSCTQLFHTRLFHT